MSYTTWHTYGYGICVSNIGEASVECVQNLLEMAPTLRENIQGWMDTRGITDPDYSDYMEYDQDFMLGLATILKKVILEAENVDLEACDDYDGKTYLFAHVR